MGSYCPLIGRLLAPPVQASQVLTKAGANNSSLNMGRVTN